MAHVSKKEIEKLGFGKEYIQLEIPKKTDCLIITTVSKAINGGTNVSTNSFSADEIEEFKNKLIKDKKRRERKC